jgi:hypothetical protein
MKYKIIILHLKKRLFKKIKGISKKPILKLFLEN